jgi:hypothetical protein
MGDSTPPSQITWRIDSLLEENIKSYIHMHCIAILPIILCCGNATGIFSHLPNKYTWPFRHLKNRL